MYLHIVNITFIILAVIVCFIYGSYIIEMTWHWIDDEEHDVNIFFWTKKLRNVNGLNDLFDSMYDLDGLEDIVLSVLMFILALLVVFILALAWPALLLGLIIYGVMIMLRRLKRLQKKMDKILKTQPEPKE